MKNQNADIRRPSKLLLIDKRRTPALKIVAFQIAAYDDAEQKGANLVFFLDFSVHLTPTSRKKTKFTRVQVFDTVRQ